MYRVPRYRAHRPLAVPSDRGDVFVLEVDGFPLVYVFTAGLFRPAEPLSRFHGAVQASMSRPQTSRGERVAQPGRVRLVFRTVSAAVSTPPPGFHSAPAAANCDAVAVSLRCARLASRTSPPVVAGRLCRLEAARASALPATRPAEAFLLFLGLKIVILPLASLQGRCASVRQNRVIADAVAVPSVTTSTALLLKAAFLSSTKLSPAKSTRDR